MNTNELLTDDSMKTYYMKTSKTSLSQIPLRKFVGSLNLKIPAVKIYSFQNNSESTQKKTYPSLPAIEDRASSKSAKFQNALPLEKLDSNAPKRESSSNFKTQKPMSSETTKPSTKASGKCLVMRNYKGLQEKINPLKKNVLNSSKNEGKCQSAEKEKPKVVEESKEKKYVGIETLKGIMLENRDVLEGFSESTIRIETDGDIMMEESRTDILELLENGLAKK